MSDTEKVLSERGDEYGKFIDNSSIAQDLKRIVHNQFGWEAADSDQQEAMDMICSKLSRLLNGNVNHVDSWVDIAGYATLVAERLKGNEL